MKSLIAGLLVVLTVSGAPDKMEKIRTSHGYIVGHIVIGTPPKGLIKCDEVPHNGDNVKYFTREDLIKMLALFPKTDTTDISRPFDSERSRQK